MVAMLQNLGASLAPEKNDPELGRFIQMESYLFLSKHDFEPKLKFAKSGMKVLQKSP